MTSCDVLQIPISRSSYSFLDHRTAFRRCDYIDKDADRRCNFHVVTNAVPNPLGEHACLEAQQSLLHQVTHQPCLQASCNTCDSDGKTAACQWQHVRCVRTIKALVPQNEYTHELECMLLSLPYTYELSRVQYSKFSMLVTHCPVRKFGPRCMHVDQRPHEASALVVNR
jgi:hypothetical protein